MGEQERRRFPAVTTLSKVQSVDQVEEADRCTGDQKVPARHGRSGGWACRHIPVGAHHELVEVEGQ